MFQYEYLSTDWFYHELGTGRSIPDVVVEIVANTVGEDEAIVLAEIYRGNNEIMSEVRRFVPNLKNYSMS